MSLEQLREKYQSVLNNLLTKDHFIVREELFALFEMDEQDRNKKWNELVTNGYPDQSYGNRKDNTFLINPYSNATLELSVFDGKLRLSFIDAGDNKGQGKGSEIMLSLCKHCDEAALGISLGTWNDQVGESNALRLVNFYRSFGFEVSSRYSGLDVKNLSNDDCIDGLPMIREPKENNDV